MDYPVRCRIVDVTGQEVVPGFVRHTPEVSRPHVGKLGWAEKIKAPPDAHSLIDYIIRITLDDGTILYGYECWWEPVISGERKAE
jgi:hypothetical protein